MDIEQMPDIAEKVIKAKEKKISNWPHHKNYTYEAGHDCARYLFYERVAWDKKDPHDVTMQFIFDGGNLIETQAIRELQEAGFKVVEMQRPFHWEEFELTGRIDARIQVDGRLVPLEIKGYAHRDWLKMNSIQDFINSDKLWHRLVPPQILLYQTMVEEKWGLLYLKSKSTYMPKVIWVNLYDYMGYLETILRRLEQVNDAVAGGDPPPRVDPELGICAECSFFAHCRPDVEWAKGAILMTDNELIDALERREQLKPYEKEYKEVDKYVKEKLKGTERAIIGDFLITGKLIQGEKKPSPGGKYEYWRTTISRIPKTS
jgi:CRISPR/Cas system-associated exonuclease Cas4 (RecB family)